MTYREIAESMTSAELERVIRCTTVYKPGYIKVAKRELEKRNGKDTGKA